MRIVWILAFAWLSLALPALAEKRLALVISNSNYSAKIGKLANPANDAGLIKSSLESVGFEVTLVEDLDQRDLRRVLRDHRDRIEAAGPDAVSFFYYSGHGAADSDTSANYLVPLNANIGRPRDLPIEALAVSEIVRSFSASKQNFVVIDACRNFPFEFADSRSISKGLIPERERRGTLIAFATSPGTVASDEGVGGGPYARALSKLISTPGSDHIDVFKGVQDEVDSETRGKQFPWYRDGVPGRFQFSAAPAVQVAATQPPVTAASSSTTRPTRTLPKRDPIVDARRVSVDVRAPVIEGDPADLPDFSMFRECETCPDMVILPAGDFQWRTTRSGEFYKNLSGPKKDASVGRFAIARFELRLSEYAECARLNYCKIWERDLAAVESEPDRAMDFNSSNGFYWGMSKPGHPDEQGRYIDYRSTLTGEDYRLPSDAEWVYASLGGQSTKYYWGDQNPACNKFDAPNGAQTCSDNRDTTVGRYKPNQFGLYDMIGNEWELVTSCGEDPEIRIEIDCGTLMARGGSDFQGPWRGSENKSPEVWPIRERSNVGGKSVRIVRSLSK